MKENRWLSAILLLSLMLAFIGSLIVGPVWFSPLQIVDAILSPTPQLGALIVTELRLPRAVLACVAGGALGLSGAVLQGFTRNPLAEPGLLGVTAGASFGAVIAIYFGMTSVYEFVAPMMGLAGALGASVLTFALGRNGGTVTFVLAGAAVSGLGGALIALALNLAPSPYAAYEIMTWLMGSLTDQSWNHVLLILPFVVIGCGMLLYTANGLDALSLGEVQAQSLGVNLKKLRILVVLGTAFAVGATTSVTGAIGFIGLVAPHLVRPLVSSRPRQILVPAAILGALLLLLADIATRLIRIGPEMKLGVLTSLIGTPFFFWLVVRLRKNAP